MGVFYDRACLLHQNRRYDLAEKDLLRELETTPDNGDAHAMLALARERLGRRAEALASAEEAIRLAPDNSYVHYALAFVLERLDRFAEAETAITEALRLDPTQPHLYALQAFIRNQQGRHAEGLSAAEAGLRQNAQHLDCLVRRGEALGRLGRPAEAKETLNAAISLNPLSNIVHSSLGLVLLNNNQPVEAIAHLQEALRLWPADSYARTKLTEALLCLIEQGRQDEALRLMPDAWRRDPELIWDRLRLEQALIHQITWPESLAGLEELVGACLFVTAPDVPRDLALRLWPEDQNSRKKLTEALLRLIEQGRCDEALRLMPDAWRREPTSEPDRRRLAHALIYQVTRRQSLAGLGMWAAACLFVTGPGVPLGLTLRLLVVWLIFAWTGLPFPLVSTARCLTMRGPRFAGLRPSFKDWGFCLLEAFLLLGGVGCGVAAWCTGLLPIRVLAMSLPTLILPLTCLRRCRTDKQGEACMAWLLGMALLAFLMVGAAFDGQLDSLSGSPPPSSRYKAFVRWLLGITDSFVSFLEVNFLLGVGVALLFTAFLRGSTQEKKATA